MAKIKNPVTIVQQSGGGENKLANVIDGSLTTLTDDYFDGVVDIRDYAFYKFDNLINITIPTEIKSIGDWAFRECSNLSIINFKATNMNDATTSSYIFYGSGSDNGLTLNISKDVIKVPSYAFYNSKITTINFENNSICNSIGTRAFSQLSELVSINSIPNSVSSIGEEAFGFCTKLSSINIPNNITSISRYTFTSCSSLISVDIPDSVTNIGEGAFNGCSSLISVDIPNIETIPSLLFAQCTNLSNITIPSSVTSIGTFAFQSCNGLTSIVIPDSVTSIGDSVFQWCNGLIDVTLGGNISTMGFGVFNSCNNLKSVSCTGQMPNIAVNTFGNCNSITKYDFRNCTTIPTLVNTFSLGHASGCQIIIPDALYDTWTTSSVWTDLTDVTFVKASEYVE